jgi:hypothetical protein
LYAPIALSTSLFLYAKDQKKAGKDEESVEKASIAFEMSQNDLGFNHSFVKNWAREFNLNHKEMPFKR